MHSHNFDYTLTIQGYFIMLKKPVPGRRSNGARDKLAAYLLPLDGKMP